MSWQHLLASAIRRGVADVAGRVDFSYRKPSRRSSVGGDVILPSLRQPLPKVAMVLDTSGSMNDHMLAQSLAEVDGVLRSLGVGRRHLQIVCCDAMAFEAQKVMRARDVELLGGGGTDMGAGLPRPPSCAPGPISSSCSPTATRRGHRRAPQGIRVDRRADGPVGPVPSGRRPSRSLTGAPHEPTIGPSFVMPTGIDVAEPDDGEPEELARWLAAGFTGEAADVWRRWRFTIARAQSWAVAGVDEGLHAAQWSTAGVTPATVEQWRQAGIGPGEAVRWHEFGYELASARIQKASGRSPDEAFARRISSRPPRRRHGWQRGTWSVAAWLVPWAAFPAPCAASRRPESIPG